MPTRSSPRCEVSSELNDPKALEDLKMLEDKEMTMREALNLALDQAMASDDRVFLLGEDIADPGASGPTAGVSTKYGHARGRRDRRGDRRAAAGGRDHDHGLHRHRRRPADQQRRETALHDRRTHH